VIKLKKLLVIFLIAVFAISMIGISVGCKEEAAEEAPAEEEVAEETAEEAPAEEVEEETEEEAAPAETLTIAVPAILGWVTTDALIPAIREELKDDNIEIVVIEAALQEFRDKELLDATTDAAEFDIYIAWEAFMPVMKEHLEPMDAILQDAGVDVEEFKSRFYPSVVDQITYDGQLYWLPIHSNAELGYARTDLFTDQTERDNFMAEYGYELPQPDDSGFIDIESREIFLDIAQFFTRDEDGNGETDLWGYTEPGMWGNGNVIFEEMLFRKGLEYFDSEGHCLWGPEHPENVDEVKDIATWRQDLIHKYQVTTIGNLGMAMTEVNEFFSTGNTAMSFTWNADFWGTNNSPEVLENIGGMAPSSWTFDFHNSSSDVTGFMSLISYGLNKDSQNKEAAIKFLLAATMMI
jgi:ABC-type glycerol-3-phosphate transport system substrate-binding protein